MYMYLFRASWKTSLGAGVSRCIEGLLVTFCCCLFYGGIVVSLTHSPFPFSIFIDKTSRICYKNIIYSSTLWWTFWKWLIVGCFTPHEHKKAISLRLFENEFKWSIPVFLSLKIESLDNNKQNQKKRKWFTQHYILLFLHYKYSSFYIILSMIILIFLELSVKVVYNRIIFNLKLINFLLLITI